MRALTLATLLTAVSATSGLARERCDIPEPGFHMKVTIGFGDRDERTQDDFDQMALKQAGVTSRSTRRTSDGCIEAWVEGPDGSFHNEYYDPDTLESTGQAVRLNLNLPD